MDISIPTKEVHYCPNNKPWVTSDPKALLNEKKRGTEQSSSVFTENSNTETHQREDIGIKVEYLLEHNITKDVWSGMRETTLTPPKGKVEEQLREMTEWTSPTTFSI